MNSQNKQLLSIAGCVYQSRLIVGSGKYKNHNETLEASRASGASIITVAIRRTNIGQNKKTPNLLEIVTPQEFTILPNTAGCYTADDAVRTCLLSRELLDGANLVKLEVLGDPTSLYPNVVETLKAAETLVSKNFSVMVYTNEDPIVAKTLAEIGCSAIMPLGSFIGSGGGIQNPHVIAHLKDEITKVKSNPPVIVDAGIGTASDASLAMELGCDGVLVNSAIALAKNPILMASAIKHATIAGRESYCAGRMPKTLTANPSSPNQGFIT